ncbi:hypothetical protein [Amycolatopsis pittospori]|uniref:hypothetical protein n=1 Tax=Amycolatopsis pittospori TaxID=2749434 RepID=UPI0015F05623|nr:hypothetical protein [Amycolatopsis pittospori]
MTKFRRLSAVAAAGAVAVITLFTPAASASPEAGCNPEDGLVCLWDINGKLWLRTPVSSGSCQNTIFYYEIQNWSMYYQRAWEGPDCTGPNHLVGLNEGRYFVPRGALSLGGF